MTLGGKTAVITGGAGQLGRVIVKRLVLEGAGVFVASHAPVNEQVFSPEIAGRVRILETDVTSEESVTEMFATVAQQAGRADILVNCAGGFASTGRIADTGAGDWDRMIALNLRSVFLCCRAFLRQGGPGEYGRIVNFTAQTVFRISRGRAAYAVAKGGVAEFTGLLGEELRGSGITVNALAPSIIRTDENRKAMPEADPSAWVDPEDIASEVLHLCGPAAGAINGAVIPMFGGVKA
jgi:NAD(P)-dependent dehydrogenase (short-subunit alcohol dehydrogenase family)